MFSGQEFTERLLEAYNDLEKQFVEKGLNTAGVASAARSFTINADGVAVPLQYTSFTPVPYPSAAVRLLVAPLDHLSPGQSTKVQDVLARIRNALPPGV